MSWPFSALLVRDDFYRQAGMARRDNHIASQCYLARWAATDGRLRVVRPPAVTSEPARPRKVGFRVNFWGADRRLREEVEQQLSRLESDGAIALRRLAGRWPLAPGSRDWNALIHLVALHLKRNPSGRAQLLRVQREVLSRSLPAYSARWTPDRVDDFLGRVSSDRFVADALVGNLNLAASVLGSMHWTLIEFSDPLLATSDQPVTVVPLLRPGSSAPVVASPASPLLECEEIRFAVGPRHVVLFTWLDEPPDGPR